MDISYLLWLQQIREMLGPVMDLILTFISDWASHIATALPLIIFLTVSKKKGRFLLAVLAVSYLLNLTVKSAFCVYRPWILDPAVTPSVNALANATGYSFPSGHSQVTAAMYGSCALLYRDNRKIAVPMILLVLLSGFLRNFLGVHTPQDVLCAWLLAGISFAVVSWLFAMMKKYGHERTVLAAGLTACAAAMMWCALKSYPMDYINGELVADPAVMMKDAFSGIGLSAGVCLGLYLEKNYVDLDISGTLREKIMRLLAGGISAGLIYLIIRFCLKPVVSSAFIYFLEVFPAILFVVWLYPLLVVRYRRRASKQKSVS